MTWATLALLVFAALGSGLMAGLFCAFSNFMMKALASLSPATGVATMQAINALILNPAFFAVFFGTAILSLIALAMGIGSIDQPVSRWAIVGGSVYVCGCFAVTALFNVPLNNRLAAVDAGSEEAVAVWDDYRVRWTRWNHVRSISTIVSTLAFVMGVYHA